MLSLIVTGNPPAERPACVVHTHYLPCPRDGQPASPAALHWLPGRSRTEALESWEHWYGRQRPFVIHRDDGRAAEEHDISGTGCPCGPEVLAAEDRKD
jgi:hypothetical protein